MSFLDNLFGKAQDDNWTPTHRATINDVSLEDIRSTLGRPRKAKGGFTFWTGSMDTVDPDYPDDQYFQLSNYDWRRGEDQKPKADGREQWYLYTSSAHSIRQIADDVGGMPRNIEEI